MAISKGVQGHPGPKKRNSKYIGVLYSGIRVRKWMAIIMYLGKNHYLGSFMQEEEAALAYDQKALEIYGPDAVVNFPQLSKKQLDKKLEKIMAERPNLYSNIQSKGHQGRLDKKTEKTSKYVGVCYRKDRKKCWRSTINYKGKQYVLGSYDNQKDAALAYDKKALELYGPDARLNFPKNHSFFSQ